VLDPGFEKARISRPKGVASDQLLTTFPASRSGAAVAEGAHDRRRSSGTGVGRMVRNAEAGSVGAERSDPTGRAAEPLGEHASSPI
jgi:hypothetical protein